MSLLRNKKFNLLSNPRKKFVSSVLFSFLSIKGRINFLQLERYGEYCEQTYREAFKDKFDFFEFNKSLISKTSTEVVIGFDPSYLSKSGKKTHGVGYFWSLNSIINSIFIIFEK